MASARLGASNHLAVHFVSSGSGTAGEKERSQEKDRGDRRNKAWLGV